VGDRSVQLLSSTGKRRFNSYLLPWGDDVALSSLAKLSPFASACGEVSRP
jgi:hypothetical protein